MRIGALEAGGTKMVCAIGDEDGKIIKRISYPTQSPEVTIVKLVDFFRQEGIDSLGVGCFGPVDLNSSSKTYGSILSTPKLDWKNYNLLKTLKDAMDLPIGFDTDVNAAALGEAMWGAGVDCDVVVYITIGTGIGIGVCINGVPLHGRLHPEGGHIIVRRHKNDTYPGRCPYHKDCLEGLAAGPAIEDRWGEKAVDLTSDPRVWELEAFYIAQAIVNYIMILSPNKIILWGGVMHQTQLFPLIRKKVKDFLNGYLEFANSDLDQYIVSPKLGEDTGCKGALRLGYLAMQEKRMKE